MGLNNNGLGLLFESINRVNRAIPKLPRSMLGTSSLVGAASFVPAGFYDLGIRRATRLDNFGAINNLQRTLDKTVTPISSILPKISLPPAMRHYLGAAAKFQGVQMHLAPVIHIPRFRELDKLWPLLDQISDGPGSKVEVVQRGLLRREQAHSPDPTNDRIHEPAGLWSPIVSSERAEERQSLDRIAVAQIHTLFDWLAGDLAALRQDFAELRTNAGDAHARMEARLVLIEGLLELPFLAFARNELNEEKRRRLRALLRAMLSALN